MLTSEQLEDRLDWLENQMATASPKELPGLNAAYQRVMNELVARDLGLVPDENPEIPRNS